MQFIHSLFAALVLALAFLQPAAHAADTPWHLSGDLSEACTCSVPCSCNFGEAPSPHAFCYALFSLDIEAGNYGNIDLSHLHLAGANAAKGMVLYIDDQATREQTTALEAIGKTIWRSMLKANKLDPDKKLPSENRLLAIRRAHIEQTVSEKNCYLKIGDAGQFAANYIMGLDGKTPVVVENNYSWNIQHGIKAKTRHLRYKDSYGNQIDFTGTNSNQGKFDWSDTTPVYMR